MAKSSRSSVRKNNNQRLKARVFGPVESARAERLSAKLLELASQPKPEQTETEMKVVDDAVDEGNAAVVVAKEDTTMDVDAAKPAQQSTSNKSNNKKRIEKRKKTSKIVFPKYGDRQKKRRS
ncbi:hypothetical protein F5Y15DRAFT_403889 [Xylariaceae sp. FL0016]|nr:hypothetical protein F5Y15DRAFT_403889 [Xylariaceae sp. FL0016]